MRTPPHGAGGWVGGASFTRPEERDQHNIGLISGAERTGGASVQVLSRTCVAHLPRESFAASFCTNVTAAGDVFNFLPRVNVSSSGRLQCVCEMLQISSYISRVFTLAP